MAMIPLDLIEFECPSIEERPALFFSTALDAVGFVCSFAAGKGVLWLSGPDVGNPSNMADLEGFFVSVDIEGDVEMLLAAGDDIPDRSLLKSAKSSAMKTSTVTGAPRYHAIAGSAPFGEPSVFAAFPCWRAVAVDRHGERHVAYVHLNKA